MPRPDPEGINLEEYDDGRFTLSASWNSDGNRRHRVARMRSIRWRLCWYGWKCFTCGTPVPLYRRADANYCSERCRKVAARARRARRIEGRAWGVR